MQIIYTACDRCGEKNASHVGVATSRYTDAAGSGADKTLDADLCDKCASVLLGTLLADISPEHAERFLSRLKTNKGHKLFTEHR
jgi:hypothetical protein